MIHQPAQVLLLDGYCLFIRILVSLAKITNPWWGTFLRPSYICKRIKRKKRRLCEEEGAL
jgi:hypothetical protein